MSGFVVMHRDALDHPLLQDGERFRAWFWMVARACWKPTRFDVHGKIVELQRGQFCCSVRDLAEAWRWSKSSVDRFLTRLKTETMIETDAGTGRLIITICNYAKYQDVSDDTGTLSGPITPPNATRTQPDQKPGQLEGASNPQETAVFEACQITDRDTSGTAAGHERDIKEQGNKGTIERTLDTSVSNAAGAAGAGTFFDGEKGGGKVPPAPPQPAPAPPPKLSAIDVSKAIFDTGVRLLTATGTREGQARSLIGKWRKAYGDAVVLTVMSRASSVDDISQPIEWITRALITEQRKAAGEHRSGANQPSGQTLVDIGRNVAEQLRDRAR